MPTVDYKRYATVPSLDSGIAICRALAEEDSMAVRYAPGPCLFFNRKVLQQENIPVPTLADASDHIFHLILTDRL